MIAVRTTFLAVVTVLLLQPGATRAQVDWGDLFPDEGGQPAAAKPAPARPAAPRKVAAPPAPAPKAAPVARPAAPRPAPAAVAKPAPAAVKPEPAPVVAKPMQVAPPPQEPPVAAAAPAPAPEPEVQTARIVPGPPVDESAPAAAAAPAPAGGLTSLAQLGLKEGDTIVAENVRSFEDYLSPGMVWGVLYGWKLTVTEPKRIEMPRLYREATERYSSQVRLGPGNVTLENYVAGHPFPHVDANDPDAVMKLMWNYYYNPYITDDYDARNFDADTGSVGKGHGMNVERHYIIDHLRRLHFNGRLEVDPKPELPNSEGYRYKESLHPLIEPFDLKGVGFTAYRYLDPARQDDTWLYLPQLRRVRRMSSAQRSDSLFGQDIDIDSYYGYNGHIAWNDYRLLGEKVMLGPLHTSNVPVKWQDPEDWFFDDVWEPRPVWVIEATSKLPQYAYGKRMLYLDKQAWLILYSDIYDRSGQLWKIYASQHAFKKKGTPTATISVYEDERPFVHAVVILDTQLAHATKAAIPSTKSRGDENVFFNMGDKTGVTEEWFSVAHLIESGH